MDAGSQGPHSPGVVLLRVAVPLVVLAVLLAVRPGVVLNAARSPLAWLTVAGVLLLAVGVRAGLRRAGASDRVGRVASTAVVLACGTALLAPSFQQRTLVEQLPVAAVIAAAEAPTDPVTDAAAQPVTPSGAPSATLPTTPPVPAPRKTTAAGTAAGSAEAPDPVAAAPAPTRTTRAPSTPAPAEPAPVQPVDKSAALEGIGHSARGTVRLQEVDGRAYLVFDDVDIEGTVDPSVHLVEDGKRTPGGGLRVGALKAERGTFSYLLPASVDLSRSWSVLVWCDPYDTPIAAADPR